MGIDVTDLAKKGPRSGRKNLKSPNPYMHLLTKLYEFLSRRAECKFNKTVLKRLKTPRRFRPQVSLSRITRFMRGKKEGIAVCIAKVTDDMRLLDFPKLSVCALKFTETARARIMKAGGECLTLDQLALRQPKGEKAYLIRGPVKCREADKHFGAPRGTIKGKAKPYVRSKGRKFERARNCR
eukprot:GHVU01151706.1.p3 GENE.GHVU01151706.1~~GHVU01151706.1.p3  ORF type:complete len:182 (+),score=26.19 GHVU01151706.1:73-618(+)